LLRDDPLRNGNSGGKSGEEGAMRYELYYWPGLQGRGEFVRLALEEASADYVDVARGDRQETGGMPAMMKLLDGKGIATPPFAPPFLKAGKLIIGQTANILLYLGEREGLAPTGEAGRLWTHQLQLTVTDFVKEIHDTHHPVGSGLYYEDQKEEAKRYTEAFLHERLPKYLGYFESVLTQNPRGDKFLVGGRFTYADLSLFQLIEGLRYAFPAAMKRMQRRIPKLVALHDKIAQRPRIVRYLASPRRIPFNESGIFRYYPELDG
jgi:glutathione S-transferase